MPKISLIVLTYNSSKHLEKLFNSLLKNLEKYLESGFVEIILVDNSSEDDTSEKIKKLGGSKVKLIQNNKNTGFAAGINLGAKNSSGEFLIFINPDAEYKENDIGSAINMFENDSKIGIIGGAILTKEGKYEKSAGKFIKTFEVFLLLLGLDETLGVRFSPRKTREVDFVSGGFMIVRKKLFEELSGFDEDFFMYIEDMELCYRVKKNGYKVMFNPEIQIVHEGQGSSSRGFAIKMFFRGLLIFQKKHGNIFSYYLVKFMLTLKASLLELIGKIFNNKYLVDAYSKALE